MRNMHKIRESSNRSTVGCDGPGKHNILGVLVDAMDLETAVELIIRAAHDRRPASIGAVAVHGVMTGALDTNQRYRLNSFDLLLPDGQPVRWALNWLHKTKLSGRVYGPMLTLRVLERAALEKLPVYLYGSTPEIIGRLQEGLRPRYPDLEIAGSESSRFRKLSRDEQSAMLRRIKSSGARLLFVGLGCPRQEVFAYEMRQTLPLPVLAVGNAFPILAGTLRQAPAWMQDRGLEWLFRLFQEPRRLWKRYLFLNPVYLGLLLLQLLRFPFRHYGVPPNNEVFYG